jgi:hypothetical protein
MWTTQRELRRPHCRSSALVLKDASPPDGVPTVAPRMARAYSREFSQWPGCDRIYWQGSPGPRNFDIMPDGRVIGVIEAGERQSEMHVVLNWLEELKQRVPAR